MPVGSGWVRCGPVGSGGVFSQTEVGRSPQLRKKYYHEQKYAQFETNFESRNFSVFFKITIFIILHIFTSQLSVRLFFFSCRVHEHYSSLQQRVENCMVRKQTETYRYLLPQSVERGLRSVESTRCRKQGCGTRRRQRRPASCVRLSVCGGAVLERVRLCVDLSDGSAD